MAAPVASYVQLPTDTSNTGKKNRTVTKVVGTDTVHEHLTVPDTGFTRVGRYMSASTVTRAIAQTAAAITTSAGAFLHMSTSATNKVGVLRLVSIGWSQSGTAVISQTAPLIAVQKYTFNTAHSGTTLDILQTQTTGTAPSANVRSAPTGATITGGSMVATFAIPAVLSTVSAYGGQQVIYDITEHYGRGTGVEFSTGEGIAVYQLKDGTASDSRQYTVRLVWDEIDVS